MHDHARSLWKERAFYRMLARMLFFAARPEKRYRAPKRSYAFAFRAASPAYPHGLAE